MDETSDQSEPDEPSSDLVKVSAGVNIDLGLGDLISRVVGAPLEQATGILRDFLGQVRFELSLRLLERAQRKVRDAGFDQDELGRVDLTNLFPILEWGSIASDESMQDRWTNLLANAVTDSSAVVPPSFADILRQLEPVDAKILEMLFEKAGRPAVVTPIGASGSGWPARVIEHYLKLPEGRVTQARLENLVRLGLAFHPAYGEYEVKTIERGDISLSALGADFVRACRPPEPASSAS